MLILKEKTVPAATAGTTSAAGVAGSGVGSHVHGSAVIHKTLTPVAPVTQPHKYYPEHPSTRGKLSFYGHSVR